MTGDDPAPLLIWGAGAIGGTIGAYLARAGHPVVLVDIVAEHIAAIEERGLTIEGPIEEFTQRAPAVTPDRLQGQYRRALLCVKAHHTAAAAAAMRSFVADDGYVVSAQNGLNEPENVRPEGFNGFHPAAFQSGADPAAAQRSIDDMVAHNRKSAKSHSGIWRDLAVRKRRTEVDAQIAIVAEIAAAHGLRAPLAERLVRLVHEIEDAKRPIDRANLDALADAMH
jgi:ketopantoate reductase